MVTSARHRGITHIESMRIMLVTLGVMIALSVVAVATSYIDTFNSSDPTGPTSFTTGTSATGLSYSISGGSFSWYTSNGDTNTAAVVLLSSTLDPATETVTIESQDRRAFAFNSVWTDVPLGKGWSIKGYGPEPFTINVSTGGSGTKSPTGGAKLVTRVEITSTDFYDDYLDTVSVELDIPGAAVYGNSTLIVNGDSTPLGTDGTDLGSTPVGVPVTQSFELRSIGDAALSVNSSVTVSGSGFAITQQPTSPIAAGGSSTFTVQFNPTAPGVVTGTVTIDNNSEADDYTFSVTGEGEADTTNPNVTINQAGGQADPTTGSPINFTVVFNESVTGFATGDVTLGGTAGATSGIVTGSGTTYNVAVSGMTSDGTVIATIAAGVAQDGSSNTNDASTSTDNTVTYDTTAPTDPTPSSSSHAVSDWDNDNTVDIQISGASDSGSGVDGFDIQWDQSATWVPSPAAKEQEETWTGATFTATSDGDWYFHIATVDNAGNWTSTQHLGPFQIDTTPPSKPGGLLPADGSYTTDTSPLLSWSASTDDGSGIRTTNAYRIVVAGPVSRDDYVSDTDYNPTLSEGTFTWRLYARDNVGNVGAYSDTTTLHIDATQPNVTIDQAGGQADPTNVSPVVFTAVFDEPIGQSTFTDADVSVGGTATTGDVTITEVAPNDDTTFEVSIVVTGDGTVEPTIPAGGIEDLAGNTNTASTSADNSVTVDVSKPSVTINQAVGQPDPTNTFPLIFVAVFDEPINSGSFGTGDVTVGGTYQAAYVHSIDEIAPSDGTTFEVTVENAFWGIDGAVVLTIPEGGVEDPFGNGNNAATSTDSSVTVDFDRPSLVSVTPDVAYDSDVGTVTVSITFDEPMDITVNPSPTITGLATDPYTIIGSTWSNGDQTWTGTFALVDDNETATGTYSISGFQDVAGNTMGAHGVKSIAVDTENPTISVFTFADTPSDFVITDADVADVNVTAILLEFSENMLTDGSADPQIVFSPSIDSTLPSATAAARWLVHGGKYYGWDVAELDANVEVADVDVLISGARDANGNVMQAAVEPSVFDIDTLNPTVTGITVSDLLIDSRDAGIAAYTITVDYSEAMTTDGSADPVLSFTPALGTTLVSPSGSWTGATTYEMVYDVLDANVVEPGIDIHVTGGADAVGNSQVDFDGVDRFDVDTLNPPPGAVADIIVEPMGAAGPGLLLDRSLDLAEGEEPPMVGECPLSAIYEVGELVTGACNICDAGGATVRGSFVHLYVYEVDIDARPEDVALVDHWSVHYDSDTRCYSFSWDTTDLEPGYYDIHFFFADWTTRTCRIQLIEPVVE